MATLQLVQRLRRLPDDTTPGEFAVAFVHDLRNATDVAVVLTTLHALAANVPPPASVETDVDCGRAKAYGAAVSLRMREEDWDDPAPFLAAAHFLAAVVPTAYAQFTPNRYGVHADQAWCALCQAFFIYYHVEVRRRLDARAEPPPQPVIGEECVDAYVNDNCVYLTVRLTAPEVYAVASQFVFHGAHIYFMLLNSGDDVAAPLRIPLIVSRNPIALIATTEKEPMTLFHDLRGEHARATTGRVGMDALRAGFLVPIRAATGPALRGVFGHNAPPPSLEPAPPLVLSCGRVTYVLHGSRAWRHASSAGAFLHWWQIVQATAPEGATFHNPFAD